VISHEQFKGEPTEGQQELFRIPQRVGHWGPGVHNFDVIHAGEDTALTPKPPKGYYEDQPGQQLTLPGMKMSAPEHVKALASSLGLEGRITRRTSKGSSFHDIQLTEPGGGARGKPGKEVGRLQWVSHNSGPMKPGEIGWVKTGEGHRFKGVASKMLSTAETIAKENPDSFASPKHSSHRTHYGRQWSRAMMKQRGEEVW
jgi:hypothetical protein